MTSKKNPYGSFSINPAPFNGFTVEDMKENEFQAYDMMCRMLPPHLGEVMLDWQDDFVLAR